ncbi:MAG TPA: Gfo/Idh/MocA family oxidoreductase, partial [Naasia sp.]
MADGIGWGILATGGIAAAFTKDLAVAGLQAVAVGSRSQESADAFGDRFGIPNRHPSYADLVADPDVDIVYIATPHPGHVEAALLALEAGKHVLVEKPFTLNAAEARAVTALAAERGLLTLEAMWTRFLPHMRRIHEIIDAGTLGEVRTVIADHNQDLPKDPT